MDTIDVLELIKILLEIISLILALSTDAPLISIGLLVIFLFWFFQATHSDNCH